MTQQPLLSVLLTAAGPNSPEVTVSDAGGVPCVEVAAPAWRVVNTAGRDIGARLDWLGATHLAGTRDDPASEEWEVVACLLTDAETVLVVTTTGVAPPLPSVADIFPAAAWHEREAVELTEAPIAVADPRPLYGASAALRRDYPLTARLATPWPGAAGRRSRVPGVPREWGRQ